MRNVSDKSYRENQSHVFLFTNLFFLNLAVFEIMWPNVVEPDRLQITVQYGAWAVPTG